MFKYRNYLKDYKLQLIIGPICKLIEAVIELFIPLIMSQIIDVGISQKDTQYIFNKSFLILVLCLLGVAFALTCQYSASRASQGFGTKLRTALFTHINNLSYANLDKFSKASLITRMTSDINQLQLSLAMIIRLVTRAPFLVVGAMIMAVSINAKISIIFFVASLIIGFVIFIIMNKSVPFYKKIQGKLDDISNLSNENLTGVRVIRSLSRRNIEQEKFESNTKEFADLSIKVSKLSAAMNPINFTIANLATVFIIWYGSLWIRNDTMSTGEVVALINYMAQILFSMLVLAMLVVYFTKAIVSQQRIKEIFNIQSMQVVQNQPRLSDSLAKIKFDKVNFAYNRSDSTLENISFEISKGQIIGLIGGTGSGKTTIVDLISRLYDVNSGEIYIDGINIKSIALHELRQKVAISPQNSVLMSGTIRENMQWGNPNVTDKEIFEALDMAQIKAFVCELPKKLNTKITQNAHNLSGGQKQRMSIARAIVKKPEILILDDSFSALDSVTAQNLRKALKKLSKAMTIIIISQKVVTIKESDKVIFLDDGMLKGFDTHENLLNANLEYKEIMESQII